MEVLDNRPKYKKVQDQIRKLVDNAPEGARLPSERELAIQLGVSFLTIRRGLQLFVDEGSIERRAGSGTYVIERLRRSKSSEELFDKFTGKVGLLVFRDSDAYAHKMLHAIDEVAMDQGIALRHAWISEVDEGAQRRIQELRTEGVRVLIMPWIPPSILMAGDNRLRDFVTLSPIPVTLAPLIPGLERYCCCSPAAYGSDLIGSTGVLCNYFHALGHKRIALLGPDEPNNLLMQKKLMGYAHFIGRLGMQSIIAMVSDGEKDMGALADRWKEYRGDLAVICYDDGEALQFMRAMGARGLYAPDDYAIVGFNDTEGSRTAHPPLTTVLPGYVPLARDLLHSAIAAATGGFRQTNVTCPLKFVVRESCGGKDQLERIKQELGETIEIQSDYIEPVAA